jgi:hypothetical protein
MIALLATPQANAQWTQTNGPDGGIVMSLASAGSNLFAQTERGSMLFRSANSGTRWSVASAVLMEAGAISFAEIGTKTSSPMFFAGTNDSGILRSTDNGITWAPVDSGIPPQTGVSAFAVIGTTLFAGTNNGVFISSNNGTSWTVVDSGLMGNAISSFALLDSNASSSMLFTGTYGGGVFLLTNNDSRWISVSTGLNNDNVNALLVCDTDLVAETSSGIAISTNKGASWASITPNLPTHNYVSSIAVVGTNIFAGTNGAGVFVSTDKGASWAVAGLTQTPVFAMTNIGIELFEGTYNGVFLTSDNGANWNPEVTGMINTAVTAFTQFGEKGSPPMLVAGTYDGGVFLTTDDGMTWSMPDSNMMNINFEAMLAVGSSLFAGTLEGVFLSTDSGVIWQSVKGGLPDSASVSFFAFTGTDLFAGTNSGLYRSTDTGGSWTISDSGLANADIRTIAASGPNLVAGGYHGVFLSSDDGVSWFADSGTGNLNIFSMTTFRNGSSSQWLFAGTANGMFLSTDDGITWTPSGLEGEFINSILPVGTNLFAGTFYDGVFLSLDGGKFWMNVSVGLASKNVTVFAVDSNEFFPVLFAGINGGGVWSRPFSQLPYSVKTSLSVPLTINAYPNPFSGSITITFSSQESGAAELNIVNLLGEEVAHLFKGELTAGEHSLLWDSNGVSPGMYECVAHLNGSVEQVPLVLIR